MTDHIPDELRRPQRPADLYRPAASLARHRAQRPGRGVLLEACAGGAGGARPRALLQRGVEPPAGPERSVATITADRAGAGRLPRCAGRSPLPRGAFAASRSTAARRVAAAAWRLVVSHRRALLARASGRERLAELAGRSGRALVAWAENHAATRSGDRAWTPAWRSPFDDIIRTVLDHCRGTAREHDAENVTAPDAHRGERQVRLGEAQIVPVLRTGGDLGSMAPVRRRAAALTCHRRLRSRAGCAGRARCRTRCRHRRDPPHRRSLRLQPPRDDLPGHDGVAWRCPSARVRLNWTSANRDAAMFGDPDAMDPQRNAPHNLRLRHRQA